MSGDTVVVVLGAVVNLMILLTVVWKGGVILGTFQETLKNWAEEADDLRVSRDKHAEILAEHAKLIDRVTGRLDDMERRVGRLENGR